MPEDNFFNAATSLIGGGFGALDAIDGADLADDDGAVVITGILVYYYHLNATSGEEESPPQIICPDNNAGDKRWILVASAVDHNDLFGLQGGQVDEYYHLTSAEQTVAIDLLTTEALAVELDELTDGSQTELHSHAGDGGIASPDSSKDNAVARWDGVGGDALQDSKVIIDDAGLLTTDNEGVGFLGDEYETGAAWVSPLSVDDVGDPWNEWTSINWSIDEDINTCATFDPYITGWRSPLVFSTPEVKCSKIRVSIKNSGCPPSYFQVRGHYYDGSWHTVGLFNPTSSQAWHEISLGGIRTITAFKLDVNVGTVQESLYFYEVEYWSIDTTEQHKAILKSGEPHADLTLILPIVDGSANQAIITNGAGILSWGSHDNFAGFVAGEHFLQTVITKVSTAFPTGLLRVTTGTGALSVAVTNITGAELEELTNGSQTELHSHAGGGATFLALTDTPANYTGEAGKYAKVNAGEDGLEFDTPAGGGVVSPIGSIIAWHKSFPNTPALSLGWVECNGQTLSDAESVYDGQVIPNLNGDKRFLRGSDTSGVVQAATNIPNLYTSGNRLYYPRAGGVTISDYESKTDGAKMNYSAVGTQTTGNVWYHKARVRPVNMSMVWIMRVK